jgi:small basic protein
MPKLGSTSNSPVDKAAAELKAKKTEVAASAPGPAKSVDPLYFTPNVSLTEKIPWWVPTLIGSAILIGFGFLLSFMLQHAGQNQWDHYVFIYSSVLNIVIAAASALLGVQISAQQTGAIRQAGQAATDKAAKLEANIKSLQADVGSAGRQSEKSSDSDWNSFSARVMTLNH